MREYRVNVVRLQRNLTFPGQTAGELRLAAVSRNRSIPD